MNRLRKTSESPRKSAASTGPSFSNVVAAPSRPPLQVNAPALSQTYKAALQPRTSSEQYWAARALTAETLLAARLEHHREIRSLSYVEETKRAREQALHDARHAKLEKLVVSQLGPVQVQFAADHTAAARSQLLLLGILLLLVFALLRIAHSAGAASPSRKTPGHFTIPILSPFTSVVEHETSVVGSKTLALFALVFAGLAYFVFRHWLARHRRN
ncbi:hypothetical protein C8R47DRAFT_1095172 [Mycena vitilis]|nr:hypothetical protein C8R47DRAFT_1095172 [Mycena vitilis]